MNIVDKKLSDIHPYEKNPRNNDTAVDAVANSIKEFGFKVPIVIDKDGIIVAGHTRYKAATKLGLKTVPCIIADDLTPEQVTAFRIADNKTGELALWDSQLLMSELEDLNIDMYEFGFQDYELNEQDEDDYEEYYTDDDERPSTNPCKSKRMMITYTDDQLTDLLHLLGLSELTKNRYDITEL